MQHLPSTSHCSCCSLSRRCFLAASVAAAAAPVFAGERRGTTKSADYIDIAGFRPQPKINLTVAIVRKTPPYWLGWPGTSYDVEGERARYLKACRDSAHAVGADVREIEAPV